VGVGVRERGRGRGRGFGRGRGRGRGLAGANFRIRAVEIATSTVATLAGKEQSAMDGPAASARFHDPYAIACLPGGGCVASEPFSLFRFLASSLVLRIYVCMVH
jgi:hypothetical protein